MAIRACSRANCAPIQLWIPPSECQVTGSAPADFEFVGALEYLRVAVGRADQEDQAVARLNRDSLVGVGIGEPDAHTKIVRSTAEGSIGARGDLRLPDILFRAAMLTSSWSRPAQVLTLDLVSFQGARSSTALSWMSLAPSGRERTGTDHQRSPEGRSRDCEREEDQGGEGEAGELATLVVSSRSGRVSEPPRC